MRTSYPPSLPPTKRADGWRMRVGKELVALVRFVAIVAWSPIIVDYLFSLVDETPGGWGLLGGILVLLAYAVLYVLHFSSLVLTSMLAFGVPGGCDGLLLQAEVCAMVAAVGWVALRLARLSLGRW